MNKRERERINALKAGDTEAESKARKARIRALQRAIEESECGRPVSEQLLRIAADIATNWKIPGLNGRTFANAKDVLPRLFAALVVELQIENAVSENGRIIRIFERMRRHYPKELNALIAASNCAGFLTVAQNLPVDPQQRYEGKRSRWGDVGHIEDEFGGSAQVRFGNSSFFAKDIVLQPDCLDEILAGRCVNMPFLQDLFGMDRHRFPEALPHKKQGRKKLYDYRAVVAIMQALLREKHLKQRSQSRRGRPSRKPWLANPKLRARVLNGIAGRINDGNVSKRIAAEFSRVLGRDRTDSGKQ